MFELQNDNNTEKQNSDELMRKAVTFANNHTQSAKRSRPDNNAISSFSSPKSEGYSVKRGSLTGNNSDVTFVNKSNENIFSLRKNTDNSSTNIDAAVENLRKKRMFSMADNAKKTYRIGDSDKSFFTESAAKIAEREKAKSYAYKKLYKSRAEEQQKEQLETYHNNRDYEFRRQQRIDEDKVLTAESYRRVKDTYRKSSIYSNIKVSSDNKSNYHFTTQGQNISQHSSYATKAQDAAGTFANDTVPKDAKGFIFNAVEGAGKAVISNVTQDEDVQRDSNFIADTGFSLARVLASGGTDIGADLKFLNVRKNYAKSFDEAEQRNRETVRNLSTNDAKKSAAKLSEIFAVGSLSTGGGSFAVLAMAVVLIVVIITLPVFSAIYPFYYMYQQVDGWVDEDGKWYDNLDDIWNGLLDKFKPSKKDDMVETEFSVAISEYYAVMNEIVDKTNNQIKFLLSPEAAQIRQNEYGYSDLDEDYVDALHEYYYDWYTWLADGQDGDPPQYPDPDDYSTPKDPIDIPIFEGYEWDEETEGESVPYNMFYDEMLCTFAAYNDSILTDGEPIITWTTVTETDLVTGKEVTKKVAEKVEYKATDREIIYFTKEQVEYAYNSLPFWTFTMEDKEVNCGGCMQISPSEWHCPGHITTYLKLEFDWDMAKFQGNLYAGPSFWMYYDMIWTQFQKDKAGSGL